MVTTTLTRPNIRSRRIAAQAVLEGAAILLGGLLASWAAIAIINAASAALGRG